MITVLQSLGNPEEMGLHYFSQLIFARFCTRITIIFDKKQTKTKNKRFGKLTTVCYVQNHSPRSGESVLPLWKALMLQPRATVQRSKHCGSWHPYISFYQTCDSWPTISHCTFHSVEEECEEHQRKSKFESKNYSCTPPSLSIPAQPFLCDTPLKQNISLRCHRY